MSKKKRWIFMVLTLALRCVYFFSTPWICLKFEFQTDWVYLFNSQSIFRDKISIWTHLIFRPLTKQLHWNKWIAIFQRKYYEWHKHINFIAMIVAFWKLQGSLKKIRNSYDELPQLQSVAFCTLFVVYFKLLQISD